ncbi:uncharacterized protein PgNI_07730 [Pyricularia grisea]|uniref:Protein kinase domain-containing protein n=1 Tax=Pyricularia grisea TaxID=148305 RepID=A0A6P8B0E8_PYRGI|nr:uncharacterized protein PgNI_07730 [Pyricularia grisea]TLD08322.1 hypothetical protein PgNI_07730 [Pyricularia grisea]
MTRLSPTWWHALGPLPVEWWEKWEARSKWFVENGRPIEGRDTSWTWEKRFEHSQRPRSEKGTELMSVEEKSAFFKMLRSMLVFRPGARPIAERVLECDWIQKWAVPSYERTLNEANTVKWPQKRS